MAPEMDDVTIGEVVASQWGNEIRDRTIQRYATDADVTTQNPTPQVGDMAYVDATGHLQVYNGTAWVMGGGGTLTGQLVVNAGGFFITNGNAAGSFIVGATPLGAPTTDETEVLVHNASTGAVGRMLAKELPITIRDDGAGQLHYSRSAHMVTVAAQWNTGAGQSIGTLPSDVRPAGDLFASSVWVDSGGVAYTTQSGACRIRSSGDVRLDRPTPVPAGESVKLSLTYVIDARGV